MIVCNRCIIDSSDSEMILDEDGVCQYCKGYDIGQDHLIKKRYLLRSIVAEMKAWGKDKPYDCMLGLSGGVDSSYTAYVAKSLGLRVLLVNVDNGFNSVVADHNVRMVVNNTGFPLVVSKPNFEEFADLIRSYLDASVLDTDIPADEAIVAVNHMLGKEYNMKYYLDGFNHATEYYMPRRWTYANKNDLVNLRSIHNKFGRVPLRHFPLMGAIDLFKIKRSDYKYFCLLNYVDFKKKEALQTLMREWDFKPYGHKHYENIFTRFYQAHILYNKFGIDKRKSHLSSLVRNGEITREEALRELKKSPYAATSIYGVDVSAYDLESDKRLVLDKLGISDEEFDKIMVSVPVPHDFYGTDKSFYTMVKFLFKFKRLYNKIKRQL